MLLSAGPLACELPGTAWSILISEESGLCSGCPAGLGGTALAHLSLTVSPPAGRLGCSPPFCLPPALCLVLSVLAAAGDIVRNQILSPW